MLAWFYLYFFQSHYYHSEIIQILNHKKLATYALNYPLFKSKNTLFNSCIDKIIRRLVKYNHKAVHWKIKILLLIQNMQKNPPYFWSNLNKKYNRLWIVIYWTAITLYTNNFFLKIEKIRVKQWKQNRNQIARSAYGQISKGPKAMLVWHTGKTGKGLNQFIIHLVSQFSDKLI